MRVAEGAVVRSFAPGRTELAGNHTDHQGGRVIAATVDRGVSLRLRANGERVARVASEGFEPFEVDLSDTAPRACERLTSAALVRGIVAQMRRAGVDIGGFDAVARSSIPSGGGLSSSAAFELALAGALDVAFGEGRLAAEELARVGQKAEREWFGKPCGLMDQLSIALGGVNLFDFSGGGCAWRALDFDWDEEGLALFLVDTDCDHSAFTDEYAQVACDMDAVAHLLGVDGLSKVDVSRYLESFSEVRSALGDRAALRGLHYFNEMALVDRRAEALAAHDVARFLEATRRSGASSAQYLQNVSVPDERFQPAMAILALADVLAGEDGAVRIHGGGFGGTVQVFVPAARADAFQRAIGRLLGPDACMRFALASRGAFARRDA